jgi:hypothetical protein
MVAMPHASTSSTRTVAIVYLVVSFHEMKWAGVHCISAVSGPKGAPRCLGRPGRTLGSADPAEVCLALQAIVAQLFSRSGEIGNRFHHIPVGKYE